MKHATSSKLASSPVRYGLFALALLLSSCATLSPPGEEQVPTQTTPSAGMPPEAVPAFATPEEISALRHTLSMQDRLYRVAAPLLVHNAALCQKQSRLILGFRAKNAHSYPEPLQRIVRAGLGLNQQLRVIGVLPGSGAERAGLREGDVLLSAGGVPFPVGVKAEQDAATLLAPLVEAKSNVQLSVQRSRQVVALDVPLTQACGFNVELGNADLVNAYGDGFRVLITRGLLQFVHSDTELAYVIAKEMAHNLLNHAARQNQQATAGGIIDNLQRPQPELNTMQGRSGLRPYSAQFEAAADRLSVYLLARAGFDIAPLPSFWQRLARQHPAKQLNTYTALHPLTDRRTASMEQAIRDVKARRAAGQPLLPAIEGTR